MFFLSQVLQLLKFLSHLECLKKWFMMPRKVEEGLRKGGCRDVSGLSWIPGRVWGDVHQLMEERKKDLQKEKEELHQVKKELQTQKEKLQNELHFIQEDITSLTFEEEEVDHQIRFEVYMEEAYEGERRWIEGMGVTPDADWGELPGGGDTQIDEEEGDTQAPPRTLKENLYHLKCVRERQEQQREKQKELCQKKKELQTQKEKLQTELLFIQGEITSVTVREEGFTATEEEVDHEMEDIARGAVWKDSWGAPLKRRKLEGSPCWKNECPGGVQGQKDVPQTPVNTEETDTTAPEPVGSAKYPVEAGAGWGISEEVAAELQIPSVRDAVATAPKLAGPAKYPVEMRAGWGISEEVASELAKQQLGVAPDADWGAEGGGDTQAPPQSDRRSLGHQIEEHVAWKDKSLRDRLVVKKARMAAQEGCHQ